MKLKNYRFFVIIGLFVVAICTLSCGGTEKRTATKFKEKIIRVDTILFTEDMRGADFHFKVAEDLAATPRGEWTTLSVDYEPILSQIMENSTFFLKSYDSDSFIQIEKVDNRNFKIKISTAYKGGMLNDPDYITLEPLIQPKKGIFYKGYWMKKAITFPELGGVGGIYHVPI